MFLFHGVHPKKITAPALILTLLAAALAGAVTLDVATANFTPAPEQPLTDKPMISVLSPRNGTLQEDITEVTFIVAMPQSWDWHIPDEYRTPQTPYPYSFLEGTITSVTCTLDQTEIVHDDVSYGANVSPNMENYGLRNLSYTQNVGRLPLGVHNLTVSVSAYTTYDSPWYRDFDVSTQVSFMFMVVAPPVVTGLWPENATYDLTDVPLVFRIDGDASWLAYRLDHQENSTICGNVTLAGLGEGSHSLVIYANDTFGNLGVSDTVFFSVSLPAPSLIDLIGSLAVPAVAVVSVATVSFGLVVYFLKRKKISRP